MTNMAGWLVNTVQVLYSQGVSRGWLKYLPYGDVLIYALATGFLFHGVRICWGPGTANSNSGTAQCGHETVTMQFHELGLYILLF